MTGYDQRFEESKPVAIRLRQDGLTPQETCTKLAYDIFDDRTKYNTVKGWYQRTFDDWPSEGHKATFKEHRPLPNSVSHQQRAGHLPKISPAYFQERQSFPQYDQNHASQEASSAHSYYRQHHTMGEALPLDDTAIRQSVRQSHHYPLSHNYPQIGSAPPYGMYQLGYAQDLPNGLDPRMSPGQYSSLPQQRGPGHKSNGNASQLSAGAIRSPHQQNHLRFQQNGYLKQTRTQTNEGGCPVEHDVLQEPIGPSGRRMNQTHLTADESPMTYLQFLESDSLDPGCLETMGPSGGGLNLPLDGRRFTLQSNAAPKQSVLAYDGQRYHPSQTPQPQSTSQAAAEPLATGPGNVQIHALPSHQRLSSTLLGQHESTRASNKHYRSSSIFCDPTPPPQYSLPATPPASLGVIHKGHNEGPWRPVHVKGDSVVTVDPDRLPTDHPRKRVKGLGTRSHDSMVIHPEHLKAPHFVAPGTPASYAEQAATARVPLSLRPSNSSQLSARSSLRDSGYISMLDSTIVESMQSSFSTLKLTDAECKTDYKEADDGYVDVEITTKGRMRRSYIERMHSPIFGPDT